MNKPDPAAFPANRRRHARVPLNLLVQCRFDSVGEFLADRTLNISEGGLFLKTRTPHPVGSQLYFQLMLREGTALVEGLGRVVRVVAPGTPDHEPGVGIEFVNMDDTSQEVIREVVAKLAAVVP